mgnify:FL=1
MHFEGRELKPYSEPISAEDLREGEIYFSITFADDRMLVPSLEPLVFIGRDLETGDSHEAYFQDVESYRRGMRFSGGVESGPGKITSGSDNQLGHLLSHEAALEVLMGCSLRRRASGD